MVTSANQEKRFLSFQDPFRCPTTKKMLPGLEIFSDVWGNKPEIITELEVEDFTQPRLFDEVAVITGNDGNQDLLNLIKPNEGPHQLVRRGGSRC
ncbi:hypothetical protein JCGZ_05070 [Jatropha curcas]|uniref:Uncharacterized protein n=1 Tax=Jatropha curcas TaxID=180498 RepID=A0A067JCQ7_JATCU|nr:hypothetical protein JCGZ_05070 [Jatropha curcas]